MENKPEDVTEKKEDVAETQENQEEASKKSDYREKVDKMNEEELADLFKKSEDSKMYLEALQRNQADYENYRKRVEREKSNVYKYAGQDIFVKILGVLDNFQLALQSVQEDSVDKNFLEGIRIVEKEFQKILHDSGVKEIESVDKPFDPNFHEAMTQIENPDKPDMTVIQEFTKGYVYHDRVLRPSRVVVSRVPQPKKETNQQESNNSQET